MPRGATHTRQHPPAPKATHTSNSFWDHLSAPRLPHGNDRRYCYESLHLSCMQAGITWRSNRALAGVLAKGRNITESTQGVMYRGSTRGGAKRPLSSGPCRAAAVMLPCHAAAAAALAACPTLQQAWLLAAARTAPPPPRVHAGLGLQFRVIRGGRRGGWARSRRTPEPLQQASRANRVEVPASRCLDAPTSSALLACRSRSLPSRDRQNSISVATLSSRVGRLPRPAPGGPPGPRPPPGGPPGPRPPPRGGGGPLDAIFAAAARPATGWSAVAVRCSRCRCCLWLAGRTIGLVGAVLAGERGTWMHQSRLICW